MSSPTPTVLELIKSTTVWLEKQGVPEPRLQVEHLLARQLGKKNRMDLYLEFDRPLHEKDLTPLRDLVRRRAKREPLQHLLGDVEFFGRRFLCDPRALIPRPETEQLVGIAKAATAELISKENARLLDVGTGSGVIAITLAQEFPVASVVATDISEPALALAAENAKLHEIGSPRLTFQKADLLPDHNENAGKWDMVLANLPYIPSGEIAGLQPEVSHDPLLALDGGGDGLDLVRRLISDLGPLMNPGAGLFLELASGQCDLLRSELQSQTHLSFRVEPDYQGMTRFLIVQYG